MWMVMDDACVPPLPYLLCLEGVDGLGPSPRQVPHGHDTRLQYLCLQYKATAMHHGQDQGLQLHNTKESKRYQIIKEMKAG
jgi:hypothetical protein